MPATKADILSVLRDPSLSRINFSVGDIIVNPAEFANLVDYFEEDDITVGVYTTAGMAEYRRDLKQLNVDPAVNPPLPVDDRATLVHELVHAMVDVRSVHVKRFDDEVAAYIAQITFMQIKNPGPHVSWFQVPRNRPLTAFVAAVLDVVDHYKLTERAARINDFDIFSLSSKLHAVAQYADIPLDLMESNSTNGVPIKGRDMRALRMAMRLAHAPNWPRSQ